MRREKGSLANARKAKALTGARKSFLEDPQKPDLPPLPAPNKTLPVYEVEKRLPQGLCGPHHHLAAAWAAGAPQRRPTLP